MASIHSLPIEIMPIIFMEGALLPQLNSSVEPFIDEDTWDPSAYDPIPFACDVCQVCSIWREIALSTPALWSKVCFTDARHGFTWPQELLRRSKANLVDFHVDITDDWTGKDASRCMELVSSVMDRCRSLVFTSSANPRLAGVRHIAVDALAAAPSALTLEYLDLRGLFNKRFDISLFHHDTPKLRSLLVRPHFLDFSVSDLASTLHTLVMNGYVQRTGPQILIPMAFPNLHIFHITTAGLSDLPPLLECPNLRAMIISLTNVGSDLVTRLSQPPLQNMLAGLTHLSLRSDNRSNVLSVRTIYRSLPNIRVLHLRTYEASEICHGPDELGSETSKTFPFPRLEHLVIDASYWLDFPRDLAEICTRRAAAGLQLKRLTVEQVPEKYRGVLQQQSALDIDDQASGRLQGALQRFPLDVNTLSLLAAHERFQLRIGRA